ncbi:MAG: hypothetical protein JRJ60_14250, partial [Deltaproteobacteria bacterium]|nr:hypothetical protein [Deltaproteobacteria bacterium]
GNGASGDGGPGGGDSLGAQNPENYDRETFSGDGAQPGGTPPPSSSQNPSSARALSPTGVASSGPDAGGSSTGPPPSGITLSFLSPGAADEVYCAQVENTVIDFFAYLDKKGYGASGKSNTDAYTRFKGILKRLEEVPPMPAGEGSDPKIIIRNLYHLFRVLNPDDLRLIKAVIVGEFDTMDANLELFYRWLTLGDRCPDPEGLRPSAGVLYHYAGFFLNTTGGRAYLYRRSPTLRMLISYYSLLIVNWADRAGRNYYGIDPVPTLAPLKQEILRYPDLRLQQEYLGSLGRLERYYAARR